MNVHHYKVTAWFRRQTLFGTAEHMKTTNFYRDRDLAETKFLELLDTSAYRVELKAVEAKKTKSERSVQKGQVSLDQSELTLDGKDMYGREED